MIGFPVSGLQFVVCGLWLDEPSAPLRLPQWDIPTTPQPETGKVEIRTRKPETDNPKPEARNSEDAD
jgi:hypothetical protein